MMQKYLQKIKTWSRSYWPIGFLLLLSGVVYHRWLSFGIFTHGDYWFQFSQTLADYLHYSAWSAQVSLGSPNLFLWGWMVSLMPGFFGALGFDSNIADKFFIFWPFAFLTPLFGYLFAKQVLKNSWGALVAALVFSFNTYYLAINTQGHFGLTLAGTFAPLVMFFFWRYFNTGRKKNLIAAALASLIVGGYDFRVFYILFFILLAVPFWLLFTQKGAARKKIFFRQNFSAMVLFFGLLMLFNLFWVLPTALTGALASNDIVTRPLVDNNFSLDLPGTLTLFHPFWNGGEPKWFDDQKIPLYFWLIPLMVIWGAYFQRKNRQVLFWFFVALLAVFLSKQNALPLKSAYVWLHQNFPGFNAFREASKFYFAIALAYSVLIGAFVSHIFERYGQKKFLKYGVFLGASLIFLWNTKPILTGELKSIFTAQQVDADDQKIRAYVLSQTESFRTLWNPTDPLWASYSVYRPKINALETRRSEWKNIQDYTELQGGEPGGGEKNQLFFAESFAPRLLSQSAVRYAISSPQNLFIIKELLAKSQWKQLDLGLENRLIFENQTVRPRIYLTHEMETIHREVAFESVPYALENSARWNFTLDNLESPLWLNFSENYHPDWQVICGATPWYALLSARTLLPAENHRKTDAGLNAFLLDPQMLKNNCAVGKDGKMELSLYYRPQNFLYLGGIITLGTILLSLLALVFWKEKRRDSNNLGLTHKPRKK
jgi:hypothetical protein